jgi:hypothetical protein
MAGYYQNSQDKAKRRRILSMIFSIWGLYAALALTTLFIVFLNAIDAIRNKTFETSMLIMFFAFVFVIAGHVIYKENH